MQRLVYTVDVDEESTSMDNILKLFKAMVEEYLDCRVVRSKLESPNEIAYDGEWEDEEA